MMLSENEANVLRSIYEGQSDPQTIAEKLGIKIEAVRSLADCLSEKCLVQVLKCIEEVVDLTDEGKRYAKRGLPERALLELIGDGKAMAELRDPSLKIGLGWLKKKDWASIKGGLIKPLGIAPKGKDEEVLEQLRDYSRNSSELDPQGLSILKNRDLVNVVKKKSWRYEITPQGMKLASELGEVTQSIAHVTSPLIKLGKWNRNNVRFDGKLYFIRPYNVALQAEKIYPGKKHPYQRLIDKMREIMLEMGFTEIKGEIIQSSFWNFDALFQPQDHPAREMQDTFYLDSKAEIPDYAKVKEIHECGGSIGSTGWGGCWDPQIAQQEVLRTHTTAVTIKYLADHPHPPVKAFAIDRVYRREAIDATHTPEFEQLEGVIMDEGVSFRHLLGVLKKFYSMMGFQEVRFRPGYFPYTEPSVEPEVFIEGLGWVELGGAGVFRKEVTAAFGIEHPVLAWGLGVSRVAMLKLGLKDLRELYESDIGWLRKTPLSINL
jgi:phenylalanyl-tRNA synthetase alpha chain